MTDLSSIREEIKVLVLDRLPERLKPYTTDQEAVQIANEMLAEVLKERGLRADFVGRFVAARDPDDPFRLVLNLEEP